jgi:hypothetical protein
LKAYFTVLMKRLLKLDLEETLPHDLAEFMKSMLLTPASNRQISDSSEDDRSSNTSTSTTVGDGDGGAAAAAPPVRKPFFQKRSLRRGSSGSKQRSNPEPESGSDMGFPASS